MTTEPNQAKEYGVLITSTTLRPGDWYWKCVEVRHLTGVENHGQHNVFINALRADGTKFYPSKPVWAGWTWLGKSPTERADPVILDKPPSDYAMGNIGMWWGQNVTVWMLGDTATSSDLSDTVSGLSTMHADEGPGNTVGHHSFLVTFRWTMHGTTPPPPPPPDPTPTPGPVFTGEEAAIIKYLVEHGAALMSALKKIRV